MYDQESITGKIIEIPETGATFKILEYKDYPIEKVGKKWVKTVEKMQPGQICGLEFGKNRLSVIAYDKGVLKLDKIDLFQSQVMTDALEMIDSLELDKSEALSRITIKRMSMADTMIGTMVQVEDGPIFRIDSLEDEVKSIFGVGLNNTISHFALPHLDGAERVGVVREDGNYRYWLKQITLFSSQELSGTTNITKALGLNYDLRVIKDTKFI